MRGTGIERMVSPVLGSAARAWAADTDVTDLICRGLEESTDPLEQKPLSPARPSPDGLAVRGLQSSQTTEAKTVNNASRHSVRSTLPSSNNLRSSGQAYGNGPCRRHSLTWNGVMITELSSPRKKTRGTVTFNDRGILDFQ